MRVYHSTRVEDNLRELVLIFHRMGLGNQSRSSGLVASAFT